MAVLLETCLDQTLEEMNILEHRLDQLYENATTVIDPTEDLDYFSMLESKEEEEPKVEITNEEAYQVYTEALDSSVRKIYRIIIRFIKAAFVGAGMTITTEEARKISEIVSSAANDGALESKSLKRIVQKGFYLIAGMGSSLNGVELYKAYKNNDTTNYVMHNFRKLNVASLPENARFRVCIGIYPESAKPNMLLIKKTLDTLNNSGIAGIEAMGKGKGDVNTESVVEVEVMDEGIKDTAKGVAKKAADVTGVTDIQQGAETVAKAKATQAAINKRHAEVGRTSNAMMTKYAQAEGDKATGRRQLARGTAKAGATLAGLSALALGVVVLVKKAKRNKADMSDKAGNGIMMATICYINENQPSAQARIRLYTANNRVSTINVAGHDKVVALRDELVKLSNELMTVGDKVDPGAKEAILEFARNLNVFFAGLVNKSNTNKASEPAEPAPADPNASVEEG